MARHVSFACDSTRALPAGACAWRRPIRAPHRSRRHPQAGGGRLRHLPSLLLAGVVAVCPAAGLAQAPRAPAEEKRAAGSRAGSQAPRSAGEPRGPAPGAPTADTPEPRTRRDILRRQRESKQAELTPYLVSREERRVRRLETWSFPRRLVTKGVAGFRPVFGEMPPGSGVVAGVGYIAGATSDILQATADARYSTRRYAAYDASLRLFPEELGARPFTGRLTARVNDFGSLRHFGLGSGTQRTDRTFYRLRERALEASAGARLGSFLRIGADLRWLTAAAGPGTRGANLELRFGPGRTPGFDTTTDYAVYGGQVTLTLRNRDVVPHVGVAATGAVQRYDDRTGTGFDFTRTVGEVQVHVPIGYRSRILALRARTSHAVGRDGGAPPFYLMETLGGADTLRGFSEYRFRDARNLLFNVEYRWEVWTYLDFALFGDFGKVFPDAGGMSLRDLRSGFGFGIRGHAPGGAVMRFDFAWSEEGFRLHVGSGPSF